MGRVPRSAKAVTMLLDLPGAAVKPESAAEFALGAKLRAYRFDRYKTKRKEDEEKPPARVDILLAVADPAARAEGLETREAVADGVVIARDLVNEPPNVLYPDEFARRAALLKKLGVEVEVLDEKAMKKLGMSALLGVGQGSAHDSRARRSCAGTAARRASRRSPSSARACASTPAASRSSPPPAWRT